MFILLIISLLIYILIGDFREGLILLSNLELIIDPICSVAFELVQEEKGIMTRPPRDKNESIFGIKKFERVF